MGDVGALVAGLGVLVTKKPAEGFLSTKKPAAWFLSDFKAFTHQRDSVKSFSYWTCTFSSADKWARWHLCKAAMHAKQNTFVLDRSECTGTGYPEYSLHGNWISRI